MVSNLVPPDVLGLQLPEAFTTTSAGQDFWELKFKNIWRPKVGATAIDHHHGMLSWNVAGLSNKIHRKVISFLKKYAVTSLQETWICSKQHDSHLEDYSCWLKPICELAKYDWLSGGLIIYESTKVKIKVPLDFLIQSCPTLGGSAHPILKP